MQSDQSNTDLLERPLSKGKHRDPKAGACVIEWLRLHEQLEFSDDRLPCQSVVIHQFLMSVNDRCPDEIRQELKPIALQSLGTADRKDRRRASRLADVACREWAPQALEARGLSEQAKTLRALRPVRTKATAARAKEACGDAASAAYAAAGAAYAADAASAAYAAADAAAHAAAYAAAYAAAGAAYAADAASAAGAAASDAASAAYAAADAVWRRAVDVAKELCEIR